MSRQISWFLTFCLSQEYFRHDRSMMESTEIMYVNLKDWLVALDVALGHSLVILAQENTLNPPNKSEHETIFAHLGRNWTMRWFAVFVRTGKWCRRAAPRFQSSNKEGKNWAWIWNIIYKISTLTKVYLNLLLGAPLLSSRVQHQHHNIEHEIFK